MAFRGGYNIDRNGNFVAWAQSWHDTMRLLYNEANQHGEDLWTVYALDSGSPKLVLMLGNVNSANKLAVETLDNA